MSRKTREKTVQAVEDYRVCDICKKEIVQTDDAVCEMCERDIHDNTDCSVWDRDREEHVCKICYALGEKHRDLEEQQETKLDAEYIKWKEACDAHRIEDELRKKGDE